VAACPATGGEHFWGPGCGGISASFAYLRWLDLCPKKMPLEGRLADGSNRDPRLISVLSWTLPGPTEWPLLGGRAGYAGPWAATGLVSVPMPSIVTLTVSPGRRKTGGLRKTPTPGGVPVAMMSPTSQVSD
jgi:hypothetical protein